MTFAQDLTGRGLEFTGSPAATSIGVGGVNVNVNIEEADGWVTITVAARNDAPLDDATLAAAALRAAGDASFRTAGQYVIGTRRLVEPSLGLVYDAIFDLAKTSVSIAPPPPDAAPAFVRAADPTPIAAPIPAAPPPAPAAPFAEYWFLVDTEQPLMLGGKNNKQVSVLRPAQWYLAKGSLGGWVKAVDDKGTVGWVIETAVRPQSNS